MPYQIEQPAKYISEVDKEELTSLFKDAATTWCSLDFAAVIKETIRAGSAKDLGIYDVEKDNYQNYSLNFRTLIVWHHSTH